MRERALIWSAALLSFGGAVAVGFLYDDLALLNNPAITNPSGLLDCWRFPQTRPLTWFSFWISDRFGENPIGWHVVSLLLHLAVAACAGLLLQRVNARVLIVEMLCLIAVSIRYTTLWISPEKLWREAVRIAPHRLQPRIQLARSLPPDQALDVLKDAEEVAPNDPSIPTEEGRILLALGRPADALRAFWRELALAPSNAISFNNRGAAMMALGQKEAARADFGARWLAIRACSMRGLISRGWVSRLRVTAAVIRRVRKGCSIGNVIASRLER